MSDEFDETATTHVVIRTSPKGPGMPFVGRCARCGQTGLAADTALEPCDNPNGATVGGNILLAIEGAEPTAPYVHHWSEDFVRGPQSSDEWEFIAQFLWRLLDNIDTASDMAKDNDKAYREFVEQEQRKRFKVGSTDGHVVKFSAEAFKDKSSGPKP